MKYLKLFKEASDSSIDFSILLDILNDLKDEYSTLDFTISNPQPNHDRKESNYVIISRGNEFISKEDMSNTIKRALEYYYSETDSNLYAEVIDIEYDAFFAEKTSIKKRFINIKPSLRYTNAHFVLHLKKYRIKQFSESTLFSKNGIINAKSLSDIRDLLKYESNMRLVEDRQFETIDMSTVSDIFAELIDNYENIKIEYGTNFIKLIKEPLDNPFDKFDNEMLEKNIDYTLMRALSSYFDITDLNIFYFISKNTLESFYKDSNEDRFLWINYDFYDPTLISNYKFNYKIYSI